MMQRRMVRLSAARPVLAVVAFLFLLCLASVVSAHHPADAALDEALVDAGGRLMIGGLESAQPGVLIVVPYHPGPVDCASDVPADHVIPLGQGAGATFASNRTHLAVRLDLPAGVDAYGAIAVDTGTAVRSLIMMQEHAVSLHRFGGYALSWNGSQPEPQVRWGVMGVPYELPEPSPHDFDHPVEGEGILMDHDDIRRAMETCSDVDGALVFLFRHDGPGDPLEPGATVHAVTLYDPVVRAWLPHPLDASTSIAQWNLYLARPGEDPGRLRAGLSPSPGVEDLVLVPLGIIGLVWAMRGR